MSRQSYPKQLVLSRNRLVVLNREDYTCSLCGGDADSIHHIDSSKDNHDVDNLLAICNKCHNEVHQHHCSWAAMARPFGTSGHTLRKWFQYPMKREAVIAQLRKMPPSEVRPPNWGCFATKYSKNKSTIW